MVRLSLEPIVPLATKKDVEGSMERKIKDLPVELFDKVRHAVTGTRGGSSIVHGLVHGHVDSYCSHVNVGGGDGGRGSCCYCRDLWIRAFRLESLLGERTPLDPLLVLVRQVGQACFFDLSLRES